MTSAVTASELPKVPFCCHSSRISSKLSEAKQPFCRSSFVTTDNSQDWLLARSHQISSNAWLAVSLSAANSCHACWGKCDVLETWININSSRLEAWVNVARNVSALLWAVTFFVIPFVFNELERQGKAKKKLNKIETFLTLWPRIYQSWCSLFFSYYLLSG
jgi:hypothetical protein